MTDTEAAISDVALYQGEQLYREFESDLRAVGYAGVLTLLPRLLAVAWLEGNRAGAAEAIDIMRQELQDAAKRG